MLKGYAKGLLGEGGSIFASGTNAISERKGYLSGVRIPILGRT